MTRWPSLVFLLAVVSCQDSDPCSDHAVLDDFRRSPLYQPQTPRDVLCDRHLPAGWYRFTIQNRSAVMPTRCASVNYCGTQAPLWLRLGDHEQLPESHQQVQLTACSSWSRHQSDDEPEMHDCCAMKYPVAVRNCSSFLVYHLQPTEACNMAYCAQLPSSTDEEDQVFTFDRPPEIRAAADAEGLNCSVAVNSASLPATQFRFQWIVLSSTGQQTTVQTSAEQLHHYDLLPRHKIMAGDKIICQVEAIANDTEIYKAVVTNPSVTSAIFTAGIVVTPALDFITAYKNGSIINITLTRTVPFSCSAHVNAHDCHLTVQIVQEDDGVSKPLAVSKCNLPISEEKTQHFLLAAVTDFVRVSGTNTTTIQLVVSSYGDAWWHGYHLSNITIQVKDAPPVQCYAFTQGHVISVVNSLDRVDQPGRYLLYSNSFQSFEVWAEYQPCYSGRKEAMCICSVEVRSSYGGETFRLERCQLLHPKRKSNPYDMHSGRRPLPQMSLTALNAKRRKFKVLESRQGKLITVVLEHGARIRVRTEEWGMSVSILDAGQEPDEVIDAIGGLCNPDNSIRIPASIELEKDVTDAPLPEEFCACTPSQDAYLSNTVVTNLPKCDPNEEECPPTCERPQAPVEWMTFFNYLDITEQVRLDDAGTNSLNLIDQPQRDSASVEESDSRFHLATPFFSDWSSHSSVKKSGKKGGTNLGRDIHWTLPQSRKRRDLASGNFDAWTDEDEVALYCSNILINSTVALECGHFMVGSFIMEAIQICVNDVSRNEDPSWAQESLGLLEDQCEVEATYRRSSEWPRDLLGRPVVPTAIVEALNCPNRCSDQGVCLPYGCVCQPGFSGSDCSLMDDTLPRVEKIGNNDGLCDLRATDCRRIEIVGSGFIDSSRLSCQIHPGRFDGTSWQRSNYNNRSISSTAEFVDQERIICHLSTVGWSRRHLLEDVSEELHLEIRVSNDGIHYTSPAGKLTLFHSGCRSCPSKKESWPMCVDREDVCYLDNSCFPDGEVNPRDACQVCLSEQPQSWSLNPNNQVPIVPSRLKTTAYEGQLLEYLIPATDEDPLHFRMVDPLSDAHVTKSGVFRWKVVSNALTPVAHETFALTVTDPCHPPVQFHVHVDVLPCPCQNGGSCQTQPDSYINSNQIDLTYHCQCREGFTGRDCGTRIDFCDPNLCQNGLCLNEKDGYVCNCFQGYVGVDCDIKDDIVTTTPMTNEIQTSQSAVRLNKDGCSVPCRNGGTCIRRNRCQCPDGFAGRQCQWTAPLCEPACQNGGHCTRRKTCLCKKGWSGSSCETAICEEPCLNGGQCSAPGKCTCPEGYEGTRCQKAVCKPRCRRGGKCIVPGLCFCREGYGGSNCEHRLSPSGKKSRKRTSSAKKSSKVVLPDK